MKITREQLSPSRVKLTIAVDAEALQDAEKVALNKLKKDVKVDGFRKGKAPIEVAKKNLDPNMLAEETVNNALSKAVAEAFISETIQVLDRPEVSIVKFVPASELEFTAEADMVPAVKLGKYKKLGLKKQPAPKVEQPEIDEVLGRVLGSMAEKKAVKRAAKLGDEVVIDFVGKKDGEAFDGGASQDYTLPLGSGSFIPGFEDAIVSHKANEAFDVPLTFPVDYQAKDLAGKEVVFEVTLKTVNEVIVPELTDDIAKKVGGFDTAKDLTADIKKEVTTQKTREQTEAQKDELVKKLIEKSDVEAPTVLVDDQIRSIEQDTTQNLMYRGQSLDQYIASKGYSDKQEWIDKEVREAAKLRVNASLVLAEVTKQEGIAATEQEVDAQIAELKKQYENNPDMAKRFDEPEIRQQIANRVLTDKTVDKLMEYNFA